MISIRTSVLAAAAVVTTAAGLSGTSMAAVAYSTSTNTTFDTGAVISSPANGNLTGLAETNQQNAQIIQTFVPSTTFTLGQFSILSGGKGGGAVTLHIYAINLPGVTGQGGGNSDGYVNTVYATDLLGGGTGLSTTVNGSGADQIINFAFSGTDQVTLTAGVQYGFEVDSTAGNFSWERSAADQIATGNIYVSASGTQKNQPGGAPQRDGYFAAYAATAAPEPASLGLLGLGGLVALRRRRA